MGARAGGFQNVRTSMWFAILLVVIGRLQAAPRSSTNDDVLSLIAFKEDLLDPWLTLSSWNDGDSSPCNWTGIMCSPSNGRVIEVLLDGLSLSGRIGRGVVKLEYLRILSLANNNISGSIVSELAQLQGLKKLNLSHNALTGPIPPSLGNISSLKYLDLSYNSLSGSIPSQLFSDCQNLRHVSLANNRLQGSLPTSIGSCVGVVGLDFSKNHLDGPMPADIGQLLHLQMIDLSFNSISGLLPSAIGPLQSLLDLRLQNNNISGVIPDAMGGCVNLANLDLSNNKLSGELPGELKSLRSLSTLNLGVNLLSGSIPSWIGYLNTLKNLNLTKNHFTGSLPSTLGDLKFLEVLDLSNNILTGKIPGAFSGCVHLSNIDLSGNNLNGTIPEELFGLDLVILRLSTNGFTGSLLTAFFNHCGLIQVLDLSQNGLDGEISPQIGNCVNLRQLNLSANFFSEIIPNWNNLHSVQVLDLSNNQLSGSIPVTLGESTQLLQLVLSHNSLSGQIPGELGNCAVLTDMDLSHNNLTGSIPSELGNLNVLQRLDLSFNKLSGGIPSDLGMLQNLKLVNVSFNQLQGPTPNGGVFNRLNETSFLGNKGLCGTDMNVTCVSIIPKPIVVVPDFNGTNPSDRNPFGRSRHRHISLSPPSIIAISAAVFIALGIVIVTLLNIREHTRRRFNSRTLDNLSQSPSTEFPDGKLVMFTKNSDPRSDEWVTSVHALLNKDSELGRGGFGTVYKAVLVDGRTVAIKKLMLSNLAKSQEDFEKEVQQLGNIKHRNLVGLQGYYWMPQLQLLIYDFIPCGNLYSRLHEKFQAMPFLDWSKRFRIALGTARGLSFLHHACHPQVVHYNIKSSNVLLDENCNPKITDYGLAKLLPMLDRHIMSSKFQSALGYMAPEFAYQSLRVNEKCDVYGFGVILLELVTGRRPVEYMEDDVIILCDYVRSLLDEGKPMNCLDASLQDCAEDEIVPVIKLALICTSQVPSNRPTMEEVVQILELISTPISSRDLL